MPNTREKLIELLIECRGADPAYYGIEAQHIADHLIANGVTFQNRDIHWATERAYKNGCEAGKPKWIPVTERLPEFGKRVLILGNRRDGQFMYIDQICADGNWLLVNWKVTHWMPLPQPPEGE